MKSFRLVLLLGLAVSCGRFIPGVKEAPFAPLEPGLTLLYESPAQSSDPAAGRLQARVTEAKAIPGGWETKVVYTTLRGESSLAFRIKHGGVALLSEGRVLGEILPEGFPDRVSRWEARGSRYWVVGRAAADLHGLKLPPDFPRVGVWVESANAQGIHRRIFYLPGVGEIESLVLQGGRWISVNRLVSRGFTDLPPAKIRD